MYVARFFILYCISVVSYCPKPLTKYVGVLYSETPPTYENNTIFCSYGDFWDGTTCHIFKYYK